jgi:hypothetical protein
MDGPGRSCPLHYRYSAAALAASGTVEADTLYVVGGLYGNPFALDAVLDMAARERGRTAVVFNGDFHWFDIDTAIFGKVDRTVHEHHALRGNVEAELAAPSLEAGCGCGYPDWVSDDEVRRSNEIMRTLMRTAEAFPDLAARYAALPMHLMASVGDLRVAIVHGDTESLAGWAFSQENLLFDPGRAAAMLGPVGADVIACSHTCLPVAERIETPHGARWIFNNGAAGMPNFAGDARGVVTRVGLSASSFALYGARLNGVHAEALPVDCGGSAWLDTFDRMWPYGSPGSISYRRRIVDGPDYGIAGAARSGTGFPRQRPGQSGPHRLSE